MMKSLKPMKIEILYFEGCPNHEPTVQRVRQVADELDVEATVVPHRVEARDDLVALGFRGSPTVLVNGRDLDPSADEPTGNLGCRTFSGSGVPDRGLIEQALKDRVEGG